MPGSRDYPTIATEPPTVRQAQSPPGREEEFRAALDRYMAFYAKQQETIHRPSHSPSSGLTNSIMLAFARPRWLLGGCAIDHSPSACPALNEISESRMRRVALRHDRLIGLME